MTVSPRVWARDGHNGEISVDPDAQTARRCSVRTVHILLVVAQMPVYTRLFVIKLIMLESCDVRSVEEY